MKALNSDASIPNPEVIQFPEPHSVGNINAIKSDPILCQHCLRTASNGIKCQGICVADSGY